MKRKSLASSILIFCCGGTTWGFTIPSKSRWIPSPLGVQFAETPSKSNINEPSGEDIAVGNEMIVDEKTEPWAEVLDSQLMTEVRAELVQKYLAQGYSQETAEKEVEIFLSDRERSEKYIEMRMYAAAQADDLGLGLGLQLLGGFLVGFVGIVGPKYYQAYKAANPGDDGAFPFF